MATNLGESNVVFVASVQLDGTRVVAGRSSGTVFGYFAAEEEIPPGWVVCGTEDIIHIMDGRFSKETALAMMNKHWKG